MSNSAKIGRGLPIKERLLLAQGGTLVDPSTTLEVLVALSTDEEKEVSDTATATLAGFPEEPCKEWLALPNQSPLVLRYFLEPSRVRVPLLPLLLEHPECPDDAVITLAEVADATIVPTLLENLDLLKTAALVALKYNPTYLDWQKNPPPEGLVVEVDILEMLIQEMETDTGITAERCAEMLADIEGAPEEEKKKVTGIVQKIAQMKVAQRVKLALLGT